MAKDRKSKAAVNTVNVDAIAPGKPVDNTDVVSLVDDATPAAEVKKDETGKEIVLANPALGVPSDFESVWVDPTEALVEFDARTIPNPDQAKTDRDFAISLYLYGQKQPAIAYRDEIDNRLLLTTGRTRRRAVILLREGFEAIDPRNGDTVTFKDENRKLWVAIDPKERNKEDQFVGDLQTQILNNPLTDVQEAYAVQKLTEKFAWTLTDAAKLFGYNNTNRAARLLKLLTLEAVIIDAVHHGKASLDAAATVGDLKSETRIAIWEKATDADGVVSGTKIKELVRELYEPTEDSKAKNAEGEEEGDEDEGDSAPKQASLTRNVAKFKSFADAIIDDPESEFGEPTKEVLRALKKWFAGVKFGDTALKNALRTNVKAK